MRLPTPPQGSEVSRRRLLQGAGATLTALGALTMMGIGDVNVAQSAESRQPMTDRSEKDRPAIVLFHGAWADGSGWAKVISSLQDDGYTVVAPAVGLGSLSADIAAARKVISALQIPTLLVGHSYGGAVITGAASGLANVQGLVYLAAFALDKGESLFGLVNRFGEQYGPAYAGQFFRPDGPFENPETLVYLDRANFGSAFVQDIDPDRAAVLAATQRPIAVAAFGEPLQETPAWQGVRSWYQISTQDRVLQPEAQRWIAQRIAAEVIELESSHGSPIARPQAVARFIKQAARG